MPQSGIQSFTVPGAVEGWAQIHKRYGKLPWKDLFQSAIAYAEEGFPVTEAIHESWAAGGRQNSSPTPNRRACFCPAAKSLRKAIYSEIRTSATRCG